jgi:hypothetical protein
LIRYYRVYVFYQICPDSIPANKEATEPRNPRGKFEVIILKFSALSINVCATNHHGYVPSLGIFIAEIYSA